MEYKGKTSYWEKYIDRYYKVNVGQWLIIILMAVAFYIINSSHFSNEKIMLQFFTTLISLILIGYIISKLQHYNLIKNETCFLIATNLSYFTQNVRDKHVRVNSVLELGEDYFTIHGFFEGENYLFINNDFFYKEILFLTTNFIDSFVINCAIINELGEKEILTFNIYEMYDIDTKGMQYFFDKYSQYKDCKLD